MVLQIQWLGICVQKQKLNSDNLGHGKLSLLIFQIMIIVPLLIYRLLLSAVPTSIVYFFLWYVPKWDIEDLKLVYFLLIYLFLEALLTVSYNRLVLYLYN